MSDWDNRPLTPLCPLCNQVGHRASECPVEIPEFTLDEIRDAQQKVIADVWNDRKNES